MSEPESLAEGISMYLPDEAATAALAGKLAALLRAGDVVALTGELGAGKTTLARALINALPAPDGSPCDEDVPSPTFTLVQVYERVPEPVWHFDLYRLADAAEIDELGWDEALAEGIVLVEWPERLGLRLPEHRLDIILLFPGSGEGRYAIVQGGPAWHDRLKELARDA